MPGNALNRFNARQYRRSTSVLSISTLSSEAVGVSQISKFQREAQKGYSTRADGRPRRDCSRRQEQESS
jgi:hypothetical protein